MLPATIRHLVALLAVLGISGALCAPAGAYSPRVPAEFFGVSAPDLLPMSWSDPQRVDRHLEAIESSGITWVRNSTMWSVVEPLPPVAGEHTYSWAMLDEWVARLARHDLAMLPIALGSPAWARTAEATTAGCGWRGGVDPAFASDYGDFVRALTDRYGSDGSFWAARPGLPYNPVRTVELWNEPNWSGFWCPRPDPEAYAGLAAEGARGAHEGDPQVRAALGGLVTIRQNEYTAGGALRGMEPGRFLTRMLAAEPSLSSALDAVAVHTYDPDPDMNISLLGLIRARMAEVGLEGAELLVTEFGWTTSGDPAAVSEDVREANFRLLSDQLPRTDCGVTAVAPHAWVTAERDSAEREHWYGLADPQTAAPHPAGRSYLDAIALYRGEGAQPAPRKTVTVCGLEPPDQDGDGIVDEEDDYPLDPERSEGAGEDPEPTPGEPAAALAPRVPPGYFGVSTPALPLEPDARRAYYEAMRQARVGRVRDALLWERIEPRAPGDPGHELRWADTDARVFTMAKRGIGLLPGLQRPPSWLPVAAPEANAAHAAFLRSFARRYGREGSFWRENRHLDQALAVRDYEIWTQANFDGAAWDGSASAPEYAATYEAARAALREVDPGARAIVPVDEFGGAGAAADFIRAMVAARPSLAGGIDGVYVMTLGPDDPGAVEDLVRRLREALADTANHGAQIHVGLGWFTSGAGALSEPERADLLAQVAARLPRTDCGVEGVYPYAWTMEPSQPASRWDSLGIAHFEDGSLKPTGAAYRDAIAPFLGFGTSPALRRPLDLCPGPEPDRDGDGVADSADDFPLDRGRFDGTAPRVRISAPRAKRRGSVARFRVAAKDASPIRSLRCRVDRRAWRRCRSPHTLRRLSRGRHVLRVVARDPSGNRGTATRRWRARR